MSGSASSASRTIRIFLSSTFRDFGEERDLLVKRVFPGLRARVKDRFVEIVDVDLRWGITAEEAERGDVLPICLAEIDRSRPFFVGLLGERYGWVPAADHYAPDLLERQPWLDELRGGKSVTELEILHGVLNDPKMAGRALFYFRAEDYARLKGGDYLPTSAEDEAHLKALKERIRQSGFPIVEDYTDPEALAERLEADLWEIIDRLYPIEEIPDVFDREGRRHEAYAAPHRRLYLGGEVYRQALDTALSAPDAQRVLITGQSGGGKSALIANWLATYQAAHPDELIHSHYTGASADAADVVSLVRRLCEAIKRQTESSEEIPADPQKLLESLSLWLAYASAYAAKEGKRWLIVLDALNGIADLRDLRWFPEFLPERVRFVISSLSGEVLEALQRKGSWREIAIAPLNQIEAVTLLRDYLKIYNKILQPELINQIIAHPLSTNPLFLRTLAEELRLFGVYEELSERLGIYLESKTVDDLFERVLSRIEQDCGVQAVQTVMEGIWASRAGLSEEEIRGFANLPPARWAQIRYALDDALLETNGRITFAHDYLRIGVSDRYLKGNNELADDTQTEEALGKRRAAHRNLAKWFERHWRLTQLAEAQVAEIVEGETKAKTTQASKQQRKGQKVRERDVGEREVSKEEKSERKALKLEASVIIIDAARAAEEIPYQWQKAKDWRQLKTTLTTREMFEAIYDNRSNQELLSYWIDLEQEAHADIEKDYETAWEEWKPDAESEKTGILSGQLFEFLRFAGRYKYFTERLARLALAINKRTKGFWHPDTGTQLNNLATLLSDKGDNKTAELIIRRALAITEKIQGPDHPETIRRIINLALFLSEQDKYDVAEQFYRRALATSQMTLGPTDPITAMSLNNLAALLHDKGDYDTAQTLYNQALEITEKVQGLHHPNTGNCLSNLGALLQDKGDYDAAEPLIRRSLSIAEKTQGPNHPDTGQRLNNLACLFQGKADYGAAEPLFRRALDIAENKQGPEHPITGVRLGYLAEFLRAKADYEAAEPLFRRALLIAEKTHGAEHSETGIALNNLARLLKDKGDHKEAESLCRLALTIAEKTYGPEHPQTGTRLNNLALLLKDNGDYESAELLFRRALVIAERAQGLEHPDTGSYLNNLALLLQVRADYEAAEPLFRRALSIAEKTYGPEHPYTGTRLNNLALLLKDKGDYEAAEPLLRQALAITENVQGPAHPSTATSLNNLAMLLQDKGHFEAAEPLIRRALAITENVMGADHPETGLSFNNLALVLETKGDYDAAEQLYRRALVINEKVLGPEHPETGKALNNLAGILKNKGAYQEAELAYRRALSIAINAEGPEHPSTGVSQGNLAMLLTEMGDYAGAEALLRQALVISRKVYGELHSRTSATLYLLGNTLKELGNYVEAEQYLREELEITENLEGSYAQSTAFSLYNLGNFLYNLGRYGEAEILLRRELLISEMYQAEDPESYLGSITNLGSMLRCAGKIDEAMVELKKALVTAEKLQKGAPFAELAEVCILQNRIDDAISLLNRCLEIRQKNLPDDDESILETKERLAEIYEMAVRSEEAAKTRSK